MKRLSTFIVAAVLGVGSVVLTASPSSADDFYPVAWTDLGIYPRSSPDMSASDAGQLLTNGSSVNISCELHGTSVFNGLTSTNIWEQLDDGSYLPNAFIDTGVDGWTPGIARCTDSGGSADESVNSKQQTPKQYNGLQVSNKDVSTQLINHYFDGTGEDVVVDWSFIESDPTLIATLRELAKPDGYDVYTSDPVTDGDLYYALGAFTIARTSENCYAIKDHYDFRPDKPANVPYALNWVETLWGAAAEFDTHASGCLD